MVLVCSVESLKSMSMLKLKLKIEVGDILGQNISISYGKVEVIGFSRYN